VLFAFEFIEGNTITRLYFMRTHFLDIPILFVIVALGAMRPNTWTLFATGMLLVLVAATG
jgi:hypothetical protein